MGISFRQLKTSWERMLGGAFLVISLSACASYRTLDVSVLKPGELKLESSNVRVMFLDRKLIHRSDSFTERTLYEVLGLRRADVVECFYDGLKDGLQNSVKPMALTKALGISSRYMADSMVPAPMTKKEIAEVNKLGNCNYLLAIEYCDFGLDSRGQIFLDDNILLRLYRVSDGQVVDVVSSDTLGPETRVYGDDDVATVCNFFYNKGWSYAERMVPSWVPVERRIYLGNRMLKIGDYYFSAGNVDDARKIWTSSLNMKPRVAVKAAVNLAWLHEQQENYEAAKQLLEAALKTLPEGKDQHLRAYVKDYIQALEQRIKDNDKITEQL